MRSRVFIIVLLISVSIYAGSMEFASFLFQEGDYYRTVTQLKKSFYEGECTDTAQIKNLLGICYMKMDDYETALLYFDDIRETYDPANDNYFITLFKIGDMQRLLNEYAETQRQRDIQLLGELFAERINKGTMDTDNAEINEIAEGYFNIQKKNALIAVLLSAVLPGGGRIYAGRLGDGLFSMSTVILPAIAAYFYYRIDNDYLMYGASALAGLFYLGELYGAYNSAKQYFPAHKRVYYETVIDSDYSVLSPDYSF